VSWIVQFKSWPLYACYHRRSQTQVLLNPSLDAAAVLGGPKILSQLVEPLRQESQAVATGAVFDWRNTEAALYCIRLASLRYARAES
jgi:hypothetical protein